MITTPAVLVPSYVIAIAAGVITFLLLSFVILRGKK